MHCAAQGSSTPSDCTRTRAQPAAVDIVQAAEVLAISSDVAVQVADLCTPSNDAAPDKKRKLTLLWQVPQQDLHVA